MALQESTKAFFSWQKMLAQCPHIMKKKPFEIAIFRQIGCE